MNPQEKMDAATRDPEHKDWVVKSVKESDESGCVVDFEEGSCLIVQNEHGLRLPEPGDTLRLFGRGFGYVVRGIGLVERTVILPARSLERIKLVGLYRYQTAAEEDASRIAAMEEGNKKKQAEWTEKAAETARRVADMPAPFRARFEFFMRKSDWGWNFGLYELFCCEEAMKISWALLNKDAIASFARMTLPKQKERVPDLAYDEHSGNTFGIACKLAHCYAAEPDLVPKMHGALCPLVGCESYGCWSTTVGQPGPTERTK
jgi:hypothetical protein